MSEWLSVTESFSLWSLFFSAFLSSTLLPGSSEALLVLYINEGFDKTSLLMVATVGNTLGGVSSWLLGFWLIWKFPDSLPKKISSQAIDRLQHWGWPVLLLSWVPVIGDPLCIAAGWLKINFWLSLLAVIVGKFFRYYAIIFLLS